MLPAAVPTQPTLVFSGGRERLDPELLELFIEEARDEIANIDRDFPAWERDDVRPGPEDLPIYLDPGLAFGTGSHPTTRLCLRWLDNNLQGGQIVLSGILEEQAQDVMNIYRQWFDLDAPIFEEGWACLSGTKR